MFVFGCQYFRNGRVFLKYAFKACTILGGGGVYLWFFWFLTIMMEQNLSWFTLSLIYVYCILTMSCGLTPAST